jgi:hypothetical protein
MCHFKLPRDCDKSFARIRLVKTENPSVCGTVNCKVCRIAITSITCSPELCECVRCNKSNHPIQNPPYKSQAWKYFLFSIRLRGLGPTHNSHRRLFPPRIKWQGSEADNLPPSNAEFNNGGAIPPTPSIIFISWFLVKRRVQIYLFYILLVWMSCKRDSEGI